MPSNALVSGDVGLDAPRELPRAFPSWLALSTFADVKPAQTLLAR